MKNNKKHRKEHDPPDIRCFCKKHAAEYTNSGSFILKRLDYSQPVMDKCDKCDRLGFDFIIITKKNLPKSQRCGSVNRIGKLGVNI